MQTFTSLLSAQAFATVSRPSGWVIMQDRNANYIVITPNEESHWTRLGYTPSVRSAQCPACDGPAHLYAYDEGGPNGWTRWELTCSICTYSDADVAVGTATAYEVVPGWA